MKFSLLVAFIICNALAMVTIKPNAVLKNVASNAVEGMSDASNAARANPNGHAGQMVDSSMHQNPARSQPHSSSDSDSITSEWSGESSSGILPHSSSDSESSFLSSGSESVSSKELSKAGESDTDSLSDFERTAKRLKTSGGSSSESKSSSDSDYSHSISDSDHAETFRSNIDLKRITRNQRKFSSTETLDSQIPRDIDLKKQSPELLAIVKKQKSLNRKDFRQQFQVLQDLQTKFGWDQPYIPFGKLTVKDANGASKAVNPLILKYVDAIMLMQKTDYDAAIGIYIKGAKELKLSRETAMLHHNAKLDNQAALRRWFNLKQPNQQKNYIEVLFKNPTVDFSIQNNFALSKAMDSGDLEIFQKLLYKLRNQNLDKNILLDEAIEKERPDFINYLIRNIEKNGNKMRRNQ